MGHPSISVILPFFNAADTIARAVESILLQSEKSFELVLVDDGSTDGSIEKLSPYLKDQRVRLLPQEHQGVVDASLTGLKHSHTPYVARMDADDAAHPDRLQEQKKLLENDPSLGVVGSLASYVGADQNKGFQAFVDWNNGLVTPEEIRRAQFVEMPVINPTLMFRRAVIEELGWYRAGDFPEDYDLVLRYLEAGVQFAKVRRSLLDWHDSPQRLTRSDERYSTEAFYRTKSHYLARWLEKYNPYHPKVWVWGAGKLSRKRVELLKAHGIEIGGYIDVKQRQLNVPCISYTALPSKPDRFILSYVGNRGKRTEIAAFLKDSGYREARDFLIAS